VTLEKNDSFGQSYAGFGWMKQTAYYRKVWLIFLVNPPIVAYYQSNAIYLFFSNNQMS